MEDISHILTEDITTIIFSLRSAGIKNVVLSPGSRSTPLAIMLGKLQDQHLLSLYVDVDERSAAFFALGIAKETGKPVLLVCTSGTAAANYYPAICEAKVSNLPLIILTTDRPLELQEIGAPQTINQTSLYGKQVKKFFLLPTPGQKNKKILDYTSYICQKAVNIALDFPRGPIHLNLPLRKPLMPNLGQTPKLGLKKIKEYNGQFTVSPDKLKQIERLFSNQKGLIIAGPEISGLHYEKELSTFAKKLHWPIIADPLSNLRGFSNVISLGDWFFKTYDKLPLPFRPTLVVRTGATPVSAAINRWLAKRTVPVVYFDPNRFYLDASLSTNIVIPISPKILLPQLNPSVIKDTWLKTWQKLKAIEPKFLHFVKSFKGWTEPKVVSNFNDNLPSQVQLFVSNSMPIREIDDYLLTPNKPIKLLCNRGANGIDGVNSTALGAASQKDGNYFLYIGDVAFFHDLTGLAMAERYHLNLTVIVQNNNGGGIFSFLPQVKVKDQFEKVFGTPLNLNIKKIAEAFSAKYHKIRSQAELQAYLNKCPQDLTILEIPINRRSIVQINQKISHYIFQKIKDLTNDYRY